MSTPEQHDYADSRAGAVRLGPIRDVRYDEDGRVLGYAQDFIGADGNPLSASTYHETEHGRNVRRERAAAEARKRLNITPGMRKALGTYGGRDE